jgi:hypothetical protein
MKPSSTAKSFSTDIRDDEISELDETVELPASFFADRVIASNDEYRETSLREAQQQLTELGELIHNALNRIATALENPPARPAPKSDAQATSKTTTRKTASRKKVSKKKASKKKASGKKVSKKKASSKKVSSKKTSPQKASTTTS